MFVTLFGCRFRYYAEIIYFSMFQSKKTETNIFSENMKHANKAKTQIFAVVSKWAVIMQIPLSELYDVINVFYT